MPCTVESPYLHDERTESTWRLPLRLRSRPSFGVVPPGPVSDELAAAQESKRVLDLLGRVLTLPDYRFEEGPALAREEAFDAWRQAQAAWDGVGVGGLVSVPTSQTRPLRRRSTGLAVAAREALADSLSAFDPATDEGRIARLRRSVGFTARVHCADAVPDAWCAMVTLTYENGADWQPRDVARFLDCVRKWCLRNGGVQFRYLWVAELQKRGAIHYHVALWLPPGVVLPKPDQAGWWRHGWSRIEEARNAVPYLMKYLSKGGKAKDHRLPESARCYGMGGLGQYMRLARRWLALPAFVQQRADVRGSADWVRAVGGGWCDPDGVIWSSEWARISVGGAWMLQKQTCHGRPFPDVGGPYSAWPGGAVPA
jgi:hypothetical protein